MTKKEVLSGVCEKNWPDSHSAKSTPNQAVMGFCPLLRVQSVT